MSNAPTADRTRNPKPIEIPKDMPAELHEDFRRLVMQTRKQERAERKMLGVLVVYCKDHCCTMHQAAHAIVQELPEKVRDRAWTEMNRIISRFERRVLDHALSPRRRGERHAKVSS